MKFKHFAIATCLGFSAAPGVAQDANAADPYNTAAPVQQEEDHDFPWGLLGLLGLAGLLGRKRDNRDHDHRTTTGTGNNNR